MAKKMFGFPSDDKDWAVSLISAHDVGAASQLEKFMDVMKSAISEYCDIATQRNKAYEMLEFLQKREKEVVTHLFNHLQHIDSTRERITKEQLQEWMGVENSMTEDNEAELLSRQVENFFESVDGRDVSKNK